MLNRLSRFLFTLTLFASLPAIGAEPQVKLKSPNSWTILYYYTPDGSPIDPAKLDFKSLFKGDAMEDPETPIQKSVTIADGLKNEIIKLKSGALTELWKTKEYALERNPWARVPGTIFVQRLDYDPIKSEDYGRIDEIGWVSPDTVKTEETIFGKLCWRYAGADGKAAWFEVANGMPVAYAAEGILGVFSFPAAGQQIRLRLPTEWQASLDEEERVAFQEQNRQR